MIHQVVELVELELGFGGLADQLLHIITSVLLVLFGGMGSFLRSFFVKFVHDRAASHLDREWLLYPWVVLELINSWPLTSIVAEHFQDEVLEFGGEVLASDLLPVGLELVVQNEIVEVLILLGLLEGEDTLDDDEKDDTSREDIDLSAIVLLSLLDFWSHVGHGSPVGFQLVDFLICSEAKICDFKIELVVH